jgi:hypothetical protein
LESCLKEQGMAKCITPKEGYWLQYQLKLSGFTHYTVAKEASVSVSMVSHFLRGGKDSHCLTLNLTLARRIPHVKILP